MRNEREDFEQPEEERHPYTGSTQLAIIRELEFNMNADPYKLSEYFGVPYKQVLAIRYYLRNLKAARKRNK